MTRWLARKYPEESKLMTFDVTGAQEPIEVVADWDPEAAVWVAVSEQVPGLVAEAATMDDLVETLEQLIPQLLRDNGAPAARAEKIDYQITAHIKREMAVAAAA
jgi:uncharacterized protein DUF1902